MTDRLKNVNIRLFADDWEFIKGKFHRGMASRIIRELVHQAVVRFKKEKKDGQE